MSSHGDGGSPTMSSIFRRIPSVRERARRGSLGQISGGAAIHDAVAKGKIHLAKFILDAVEGHCVVNSRDSHGKTPLIRAMKVEDCQTRLKVAQLLIQHGANVNHKDNMGRTALSYAAELHYNDVIKILVKNNVDPNIEDNNGNTPLMYCSMVGNATGILILTRSFRRLGLDVDRLNGEGMSALMTAAKNGDMECVKLLAHEGKASLDQRDQIKNMTAAEWARVGGCSTPELEAFLPKIRRQSKPTDSSPTKQNVDPRSNLQKNESMESNCSSVDGCSPRGNSKDSSTEELSPRPNCSKGTIAVPTPPTYRKNPQQHMDALSRRFHALHPVKNINDIPVVRKHLIEMKRASLPEVTNPDALHYQYAEDAVSLEQDPDNRSTTNNIFVKRTKPSSLPRRPLSAINRHSNQRQSKSFDGVTYERSSNSEEDLTVQNKMGKSLTNLYLENPTAKNLLNLSFLSRSTDALSPVCSSPDAACMRHSVNSTTHINVDIDSCKLRPTENMLRVDVHGQGGDHTPRLPPLSPKRVVTGQ